MAVNSWRTLTAERAASGGVRVVDASRSWPAPCAVWWRRCKATRPDVAGALRRENAAGGQPGQLPWRNALVVTQLTISLALLVGTRLVLRSFRRMQSVDAGFGGEPPP